MYIVCVCVCVNFVSIHGCARIFFFLVSSHAIVRKSFFNFKKSVVCVAQCVAALIPVQGLSSFFSNTYCLFDPSSTFVRFSVQNSSGRPIDHVVIMRCSADLFCSGRLDALWYLVPEIREWRGSKCWFRVRKSAKIRVFCPSNFYGGTYEHPHSR